MKFISCDGQWATSPEGYLTCTGTLSAVDSDQLAPPGMTPEVVDELRGQTIVLFAIVFGILAIKKAVS
jgi:hypothetical protein